MLWPVFIILLLLWLAATVASFTMGGLIHVLLGLAVIVLLAQVIKRPEKEPDHARRAARETDDTHDTAEDKRRSGAA